MTDEQWDELERLYFAMCDAHDACRAAAHDHLAYNPSLVRRREIERSIASNKYTAAVIALGGDAP